MLKKIIFLSLFIPISASSQADDPDTQLIIQKDDQDFKTIQLSDIKKLKSSVVEYYDYAIRKSDKFMGVPFINLLNFVKPHDLTKVIEVEFVSLNGYRKYFSMDQFYKVDSILSYEAVDGKFQRYSRQEKKLVPLGPYYLVWDFKTIGKEDRHQYSSNYQINKINLITNSINFGVNNVKENEAIHLGFRTYKRYCISCHAIGSTGGDISFDLLKRKTLEIKGHGYVKKYILDPSSLNLKSKMVALPKYKNSDAMADGVIEFLHFVNNPDQFFTKNKINPEKSRYNDLKLIIKEIRK